jgi:hypothetical protein
METNWITCDNFKKRMVDLCLRSGLTEFPTKRRDQLVLLKSIAISFDATKAYTEAEVNQRIKTWLADLGCFSGWDHFMLRRRLVDESFLNRERDGSCYRICLTGPSGVDFDPAIAELDVVEVLREGQEWIAQKKAEFLQKHPDSL